MTRTPSLPVLLAASLATGLLVSCTRPEDPGIKEKIALLEAELRDRDEQLAARQEEASSQTAEPAASAPDLDKAKGGYLTFVESLRQEIAQALPVVKVGRPSVFPVEGPDPSKPIASRVAFRIANENGRSAEIEIPLFAGPDGRWQQPETAETIAAARAKLSAPAVATNTPAPQPAAPQPAASAPAKPLVGPEADKTIKIDWNDGPKQGQKPPTPSPQPPQTPQPPPQPQSPAVPKKAMPASREVIIDFE